MRKLKGVGRVRWETQELVLAHPVVCTLRPDPPAYNFLSLTRFLRSTTWSTTTSSLHNSDFRFEDFQNPSLSLLSRPRLNKIEAGEDHFQYFYISKR
jgi:hypothetical protein